MTAGGNVNADEILAIIKEKKDIHAADYLTPYEIEPGRFWDKPLGEGAKFEMVTKKRPDGRIEKIWREDKVRRGWDEFLHLTNWYVEEGLRKGLGKGWWIFHNLDEPLLGIGLETAPIKEMAWRLYSWNITEEGAKKELKVCLTKHTKCRYIPKIRGDPYKDKYKVMYWGEGVPEKVPAIAEGYTEFSTTHFTVSTPIRLKADMESYAEDVESIWYAMVSYFGKEPAVTKYYVDVIEEELAPGVACYYAGGGKIVLPSTMHNITQSFPGRLAGGLTFETIHGFLEKLRYRPKGYNVISEALDIVFEIKLLEGLSFPSLAKPFREGKGMSADLVNEVNEMLYISDNFGWEPFEKFFRQLEGSDTAIISKKEEVVDMIRNNIVLPPPEAPAEKELLKPSIIKMGAVPEDFMNEVISGVASGLGVFWDSASTSAKSVIDGFGEGFDYVKTHIVDIAVNAVLSGMTLAGTQAIFSKLATRFPVFAKLAPVAATSATTASVASKAAVQATTGASKAISPWIKALVVWNVATDWVWIQNMLGELGEKVTGDLASRGRDLRYTINTQMKELNNKIAFAEEEQDWDDIKTRVDNVTPLIEEYGELLKGANIDEHLPELWDEYQLMLSNIHEFSKNANKALGVAVFPEELVIENVRVVDGDSIEFPGHPEVKNEIRFIGIDAHETGTMTGQAEKVYLENLIGGKTVTLKIDPHPGGEEIDGKQIGYYGRLLAVPFIDDKNVCLEMLRTFGKSILTATKYMKKYKYVDWDEYKAAADEYVGMTGKLKIYTKPAYCSIWIDGEDTGKISIETFELPAGDHEITIMKPGYADLFQTVTILASDTIERRYELVEIGELPPGEEVPAAVEFKINIDSEPTNAKLYIDNVYTHHLTPTDQGELKDVMGLLTIGKHTIKVTKADMMAEQEIDIVAGDNGTFMLTLEVPGLPAAPEVPPEVPPEVIPPEERPPLPAELPPLEEWTDMMKAVAYYILTDIEEETIGIKSLSKDELKALKIKYGVEGVG